MKHLLVPVIMCCAIGGTVGALKLIHKYFPDACKTQEQTEEWIKNHQ